MKTYLITGCAGFIGSNFVHYMLKKYPEILLVNLDKLTYAGNLENLKDVEGDPRHVFVQGDICDKELVESLFQKYDFDYVINFAAESHVDRTIKNQEQTIRSSMQTLYNDIMQKQTALQLADASLAAETQAMNAMQKKLELGMATQLEYKSEEVSVLEKQIDKETANMNLQQAIETYEWALKGYMK